MALSILDGVFKSLGRRGFGCEMWNSLGTTFVNINGDSHLFLVFKIGDCPAFQDDRVRAGQATGTAALAPPLATDRRNGTSEVQQDRKAMVAAFASKLSEDTKGKLRRLSQVSLRRVRLLRLPFEQSAE